MFSSNNKDKTRLRDSGAATAKNTIGGGENDPSSTALTERGKGEGKGLCLGECGTSFSSTKPQTALFAALEKNDGHTSPGEIKAIINSRGG